MQLNADASLRAGLFDGAERAELALDPERLTSVQVARGEVSVNGQGLLTGDAAMLVGESPLVIDRGAASEILVFDLAR